MSFLTPPPIRLQPEVLLLLWSFARGRFAAPGLRSGSLFCANSPLLGNVPVLRDNML